MNGKRYLLDTNAIIQLLAGNPSLIKTVEDSDFLAISVISKALAIPFIYVVISSLSSYRLRR